MAKLKPQEYKPLHDIDAMFEAGRSSNDVCKAMDENLEHLRAIHAAAVEAGSIKFRMFSLPYADGFAYYQAINVTSSQITIKAITGIGDDWTAPPFGNGGKFPSKMIRQMLGIPVYSGRPNA